MWSSETIAGHLVSIAVPLVAWGLTYLLHSSLLLGTTWLVTWTGAGSPRFRETLWKVAVLGGVFTASIQSLTGIGPVTSFLSLPAFEANSDVRTPAPVVATAAGLQGAPAEAMLSVSKGIPHTASAVAHLLHVLPVGAGGEPAPPVVGTNGGSGPIVPRTFPWPVVVVFLWLTGVVVGLARFGLAHRRLARQLGTRCNVPAGSLASALQRLVDRTGVVVPLRLTTSNVVHGPLALGRGEICVPQRAVTDLSVEQQECMLAHELAHLLRGDPRWLIVLGLVDAVCFFQPLNRVARRALREEAEFLCDEWAVRHTDRLSLAKCIATVAAWMTGAPVGAPVAALAQTRSSFLQRVRRILDAPPARRDLPTPVRMVLVAIPLSAITWLAPRADVETPPRLAAGAGLAGDVTVARLETAPAVMPAADVAYGPDGELTLRWTAGRTAIEVRVHGDVEFAADLEDVDYIAEGGYLIIEEARVGRTLRFEARGWGDVIDRRWIVNGESRPFDSVARRWLRDMLPELADRLDQYLFRMQRASRGAPRVRTRDGLGRLEQRPRVELRVQPRGWRDEPRWSGDAGRPREWMRESDRARHEWRRDRERSGLRRGRVRTRAHESDREGRRVWESEPTRDRIGWERDRGAEIRPGSRNPDDAKRSLRSSDGDAAGTRGDAAAILHAALAERVNTMLMPLVTTFRLEPQSAGHAALRRASETIVSWLEVNARVRREDGQVSVEVKRSKADLTLTLWEALDEALDAERAAVASDLHRPLIDELRHHASAMLDFTFALNDAELAALETVERQREWRERPQHYGGHDGRPRVRVAVGIHWSGS